MYSFGPNVYENQSALIGGDFDNSIHRDQTHAAGISFTKMIGPRQAAQCGSCVQ